MSIVTMKSSLLHGLQAVLRPVRQRVGRVLPVDEPAVGLVGLAREDVVAQLLEHAQLERHQRVLPGHAVEPLPR